MSRDAMWALLCSPMVSRGFTYEHEDSVLLSDAAPLSDATLPPATELLLDTMLLSDTELPPDAVLLSR